MAHPYSHEAKRHSSTKMKAIVGHSHGGVAHTDEAADKVLINRLVAAHAEKRHGVHGLASGGRLDKAKRGGGKKKHVKITVVAPQTGQAPTPSPDLTAPPPGPGPAPGPALPMGGPPPMGMPPGMPMRKRGGSAYKHGGRVVKGPEKMVLTEPEQKKILKKARGGGIGHDFIKMKYGAESGEGRKEKIRAMKGRYP